MRISELLNLTKFDVDIKKRIITGGVKTDAGKNRAIPINPKVYKYIKKWYNKGNNYLIFNAKGEKMTAKNYREDRYYPVLEKLGIRKLTPHCTRHTFASLMAKAGANTKAIQEIIGHEDYAFTANEYTHPDIEELKKAINMI